MRVQGNGQFAKVAHARDWKRAVPAPGPAALLPKGKNRGKDGFPGKRAWYPEKERRENTCGRERVSLPVLFNVLRRQQPSGPGVGPVTPLFTDVPIAALQRFATYHGLSMTVLVQYYEQFVRPVGDVNEELERWIRKPLGNPV